MAAALPVIGGLLGVANAVMGLRSQQMQQQAMARAQGLTEEQARELSTLRAILSDPNHPIRAILRAQAEQGIGQQVSTGIGDLTSRLASMGFRSPASLAAPVSNILGRGVAARGELERSLITDFIQRRMQLAGLPNQALGGSLDIAGLAGQQAYGAGQALGSLLEAFRQGGFTYTSFQPWRPRVTYAGIGPGGYETYKTGKYFLQ
jgi:hypothetical protein